MTGAAVDTYHPNGTAILFVIVDARMGKSMSHDLGIEPDTAEHQRSASTGAKRRLRVVGCVLVAAVLLLIPGSHLIGDRPQIGRSLADVAWMAALVLMAWGWPILFRNADRALLEPGTGICPPQYAMVHRTERKDFTDERTSRQPRRPFHHHGGSHGGYA